MSGQSLKSNKSAVKKGFKSTGNVVWDAYLASGVSYQEANSDDYRRAHNPNTAPYGSATPTYASGYYDNYANYIKEQAAPKFFFPKAGTGVASEHVSATDVKFNLPPHKWSLPLERVVVTNDAANPKVNHGLRRARMWFWGTKTNSVNTAYQAVTGASPAGQQIVVTEADNYWGFQFLWNPTEITNAVSRNGSVTPSVTDRLAGQQGLFTTQETVQFKIVLDRVNDFAWAAAINGGINNVSNINLYNALSANSGNNPYTDGGNPGITTQDQVQQVVDLLKKGTMADLEYLYRTINGNGVGGAQWTNALGRTTADIGFLMPNPIALQLGPTGDNLSYVGWVDSLVVDHQVFTQNMVPIHTEVSVTFNVFSNASLISTGNG